MVVICIKLFVLSYLYLFSVSWMDISKAKSKNTLNNQVLLNNLMLQGQKLLILKSFFINMLKILKTFCIEQQKA